MEVSKNAWHYKILMTETQAKIRNGTSLCSYFWDVVFTVFAWIFIGIMSLVVIVCVLTGLFYILYAWYFMIGSLVGVETFSTELIRVSLVLNYVGIFCWFVFSIKRLLSKLKNGEILKSDNLAFEYIKAKKQKICPVIQFKD